MTVEQLQALNLPTIEANEETALYIDAGLDWLSNNTILAIDKENIESSVAAFPAGAKIFLCKYYEIMTTGCAGIASESIGGMSQSFTTESKNTLLWNCASELLAGYLKGQVKSIGNISKWL